jgi:hypothetical protein
VRGDLPKDWKNCHPSRSEGSTVRPQSVGTSAVPNASTVAAMQQARDGQLPSFCNVSDKMADLNADD